MRTRLLILALTIAGSLLLIAGGSTPSGPTNKVELHNGQSLNDSLAAFDGNAFTFKKAGQLPRDEVKEIKFILAAKPKETEPPVDAADAEQIKEWAASADEAVKKYPHANGISIVDDGHYTLNADSTRKYRYHFVGKILTNKAKEWGNHVLYLEEERSRTKVVMGRTITPEGKVINLDPTTIKIAAPARDMVKFGTGKQLSFSLPSVEVGCLIEYIYEYDTFNPGDKEIFEPGWWFQDTDPVLYSRVRITVPADKDFYYVTKNIPTEQAKPQISTEGETKTYTWEARNVEPLTEETAMPNIADVVPRLEGSLFKDWSYLFNWGSNILSERIKVTPELARHTKELIKDAKTIDEKIAALYYYAQRDIRYISIKGSMSSSWGGHPAYQTLENKYGDCVDKAILFSTMLKEIGVEAYPVTLKTNEAGTAITDIPIRDANHAITEVHLNGKIFYLDPVTRNYRYPYFSDMDHGIKAINEITGQINFINVPPPGHNLNSYSTQLTIKPNGEVEGKTQGDYTGAYEARLRGFWETVPEAQRPGIFQGTVNRLSPGGKLNAFQVVNQSDISKPLKIVYDYTLPDYPIFAGDLMIFGVPGLQYDFGEAALDKRKYDLVYRTSRETKHYVTMKIPEGYAVKYLPPAVELECSPENRSEKETPYSIYEASYEYNEKERLIIFKDDFKRFARIVPAKDYQNYKKFLQKVSSYPKEKIFFAKQTKETQEEKETKEPSMEEKHGSPE